MVYVFSLLSEGAGITETDASILCELYASLVGTSDFARTCAPSASIFATNSCPFAEIAMAPG